MDKEVFFMTAVALALAVTALVVCHLLHREYGRPTRVYPIAVAVPQQPAAPSSAPVDEVTVCSTIWEEIEGEEDDAWELEEARTAETKEEPATKQWELRF